MAAQPVYRDVVVIGAGWSGLMACKSMLEVGLSVIVLEKRENIGGLWCYTDDPEIVSVMKRTQCTSSSSITEFSDFPMPDEMGEFPTHSQILQYLNDYCAHFKLHQHICFGCDVKSADKMGDKWEVIVEEGTKYISKNLVLCTGANQSPRRELESTLFAEYTGEIMHSQTLKSFITTHKNKTVLIFGGGETAADIVEEWHDGGAKKIIWCIPRGQHFFRKYAKLLPHRSAQTLDKASSRAIKILAPFTKGKPGLSWVCFWTTAGSLLAYQGHGIPEWKNNADFFHFFINKNGHVLDLVDYDKVVPKGAIQSVKEKKVVFSDGSQADSVDVVIQCTGYYRRFPFLPTKYQVPMSNLYKFIFNVDDPSIAFVGYTRPIVGSIPILAELQAMYVARVFSGLVKVADNGALANETNQDKEFWCNYFKDSSHRLDTLVESYTYLDDLADKAGVSVNFWELLKSNPRDWVTAMFSPACASSMRLSKDFEADKREAALANLRRRSAGCVSPLQYILIFFLRLIWFNWWLQKLGTIKYFFQTNRLCRKIQKLRVVRFLDWMWTTPKRLLFDNKSRPFKKFKMG